MFLFAGVQGPESSLGRSTSSGMDLLVLPLEKNKKHVGKKQRGGILHTASLNRQDSQRLGAPDKASPQDVGF